MFQKKHKSDYIMQENITPYILEYASEKSDYFGIVSVIEVRISRDHSYADFYVNSQYHVEDLPKFLSQFAWEIRSIIGKELGARKSPTIRFKVAKNTLPTQDILSLIQEETKKYGLNTQD